MAWTTPRTWSPGETVTATLMNTHVRDNLNALKATDDALLGVSPGSWCADGTFLIWPSTTTLAHWTPYATNPTIARAGAGQADTQVDQGLGGWALKLTRGAAAGGVQQTILHATGFPTQFRGKYFSAGCWVKTALASSVKLFLNDGIGSSGSAFHDGTTPGVNNGYQWMTVTRLMDAAATQLILKLDVAGATTPAYFSGATVVPGSLPPTAFVQCPQSIGVYLFPLGGTQSVGTNKARYMPARPSIVRHVQLQVVVAPTGAALIVDVNSWDGSAYTSMFTTRPQIAASGSVGGAAPDGTYERRCLSAYFGSGAAAAGAIVNADVDQVGSTAAGGDLTIRVMLLQFLRPQEQWLPFDSVA